VLLTSSARVAIISASWLDVSMTRSVSSWDRVLTRSVSSWERLTIVSTISWERPCIMSTTASDFSEKPLGDVIEPRRHHVFEAARDLDEILAEWSVLKLRLAVSCWLAVAMARAVSSLADSRRTSRSPPRSLSWWIMLSPTSPSASVICSPFSASEWVMRWAASLTCWPTRSLMVDRSCGQVDVDVC